LDASPSREVLAGATTAVPAAAVPAAFSAAAAALAAGPERAIDIVRRKERNTVVQIPGSSRKVFAVVGGDGY
jgi:hypothetical protein